MADPCMVLWNLLLNEMESISFVYVVKNCILLCKRMVYMTFYFGKEYPFWKCNFKQRNKEIGFQVNI